MAGEHELVRVQLERDLVDESDRPELRLIWADLLQLDGDPLGRLIVLDQVRTDPSTPSELAERLVNEADALRRELGPRLWSEPIPELPGITFDWRRGFVHTLEIDADQLASAQSPPIVARTWARRHGTAPPGSDVIAWLLPILVRQPALRWLEIIRITTDDFHALAAFGWITQARLSNPILREIHVGRPPTLRARPAGTWEPHRAQGWRIDRVAEQGLRQLRCVSVGGERVRLACCDGNHQARVHHVQRLGKRPLTITNKTSLARALWDESVLVQAAAFELARELGPRAEFLLPELLWFLRPPLGKADPRPTEALQTLVAIGPASASVLPMVLQLLARPEDWVSHKQPSRVLALVDWIVALGPLASAAQPLLDVLRQIEPTTLSAPVMSAITRGLRAIQ